MKTYYRKIAYTLLTGLIFSFTACEGDDEGGGQSTETHAVTLTINTQTMTDARAATGTSLKNNGQQADKMHNLWIYVVNPTDNKVEAVIEKSFAEDALETTYAETVQLTGGAKKLYGFANLWDGIRISAGIATSADGRTANLKAGDTFPGGIGTATCRTDQREENYIPMSAVQNITITHLPAQKYILPLLRTMCKITFSVKNESASAIQLEEIVTGKVTPLDSPVYLLPQWDENGKNILPAGTVSKDIAWAWPSAPELAKGATSAPFTIYLNESQAANDGWFTFQLNTAKDGVTNTDRFSISNTQSLNRNDYLPIEITLTDYKLRLDVLSYPPIGGYPSVDVPMKDKEYYAHFPGGGPFIITPKLSKYSTGEEITEGVTWSMELTGDLDIFDVKPVMKNNEVTGTLKHASQNGKKALCTMTASVTETGTSINRVLTYKVYIMNYQ